MTTQMSQTLSQIRAPSVRNVLTTYSTAIYANFNRLGDVHFALLGVYLN